MDTLGMALQPAIQLDNREVGNAVPHGFFHAEVLPEEHTMKCMTEWSNETSLNVTTNKDSYVRLEMMMGLFVGHVIPKEVSESEAADEMKDLHLADHN